MIHPEQKLVILDSGEHLSGNTVEFQAQAHGWEVIKFNHPQVAYEHLTGDISAVFIGTVDKHLHKKIPNVFGLTDFVEMAADLPHVSMATAEAEVMALKGASGIRYLDPYKSMGEYKQETREWLGNVMLPNNVFPLRHSA
jgi:hypothetical protein